ncbi:Cyanovirin-N [Hygrophoropsis aurantiaca]|uniref:Cyanovirin-N n=1 Tax=Hygrophoropsis aurantiaca TaxID=72124 RepID=A0ACB8AAV1_9AGAM|nr:Cyanovirin-N [Hygrophoropsis aurantiaca]
MQFTSLSIVFSGLFVFATSSAVAYGGFANSCTDYYVTDATLIASCTGPDEVVYLTSINTAYCIADTAGSLECAPNGQYTTSCSNCFIESGTTYMLCDCEDGSGGDAASIIDLDSCISNMGGALAC